MNPSQLLPADQVVKVCGILGHVISEVVPLMKGGGILGALGLISDFGDLKGVNWPAFIDQVKDLDPEERKACLAALKKNLVLDDKSLEQKIESGADCLDEVVDVGVEAYHAYQHGQAVVEKVKALVGAGA